MKRTTILADEELLLRLRLIARRRRVGTSTVIREALAEYVARESDAGAARWSFAGIGRHGGRGVSGDIDKELDEIAEEIYLDAMGLPERADERERRANKG